MTSRRRSVPGRTSRRIGLRAAGITGTQLAAQLPGVLIAGWPLAPADLAALCGEVAFNGLVLGLCLALVLEWHGRPAPGRRGPPPALWIVVAAGVVALLSAHFVVTIVSLRIGLVSSIEALRLHQAWIDLLVAALTLAYVLQRGASIEAESRFRQHELQCGLARRRAETTLARAAHMRLDARILLDSLDEAMTIYPDDPLRADARLERLTTYLRVVMKASESRVATLGDEVAIGAALLPLACDGVELAGDVPDAFGALPIASGAVPALLRSWADALGPEATPGSSFLVRVEGSAGGAALEIVGPCPVPDGALAACRNALVAGAARVGDTVVRLDPTRLRFTLEATANV